MPDPSRRDARSAIRATSARPWGFPSPRTCGTVERRLVHRSLSHAWRALPTPEQLGLADTVEVSRSFCTTDDALAECMTCGVVSAVSSLRVRAVERVASGSDAADRTLVSIACPVCSARGSVVLTAGSSVSASA